MKFNKFISYLFHPIIFPIISTIIYFIILPRYITKQQEFLIILTVFIGTYILPLLFMVVLKKMKLIDNYQLENIGERKFPILILVMLSYIIGNLLQKMTIVDDLAIFFFGISLSLIACYFLLFNKFKTSLHSLGISGLIGFLVFFSYRYQINLLALIAFFFILSGLVASSRISLNTHNNKEVYSGFLIGFLSQIMVFGFFEL